MEYKSRNDVPEKYKWDLTDLFKDEKDFSDSFECAKDMIKDLKQYVGCTKDKEKLYEFITKDLKTMELVERLYCYTILIDDQELGISKSIENMNKAADLMNEYNITTNFFNPELLKLNKNKYEDLFANDNKLNEFKKMLDDVYRNKEHILSEKEEKIISELFNAMNNFSSMSSTMLNSEHDYGTVKVDGEKKKITTTNYRKLMKNEDRELRKEIRTKFNKVLENYAVSSSQFLNSYVKSNLADAKLHNFKNAWDAKLFGLKISDKSYRTLVKVVESRLDSLQRFFEIYRKHFGYKKLYQYDLGLELSKNEKEYSIEEGQQLCLNALKVLGDDYVKHLKRIIDNHYVDYAQYPSKCSGGYSMTPMNSDSKILMSFNYDLDSVSTLVHECGHHVHHQFINENNPLQYHYASTLISEVASLTNECLLSNYIANHSEDIDEKIAGIYNIIRVIVSNLFGAVREAEMEQEFYKSVDSGNSITKDYMNDLTRQSFEKYYGNTVELDGFSGLSWINRSHYYNNYYLYDYAFCICIASNIAKEIINGNKEMLDKYYSFLKCGSSKDIIEIYKTIDIDLENEKVYENAINYFDELLDKLENLL